MPAVNYVIYGCSSSRTAPGVITIQELHTGGKTFLQLLLKTDDRWYEIDDNLKRQIKIRTLYTCRLFLPNMPTVPIPAGDSRFRSFNSSPAQFLKSCRNSRFFNIHTKIFKMTYN